MAGPAGGCPRARLGLGLEVGFKVVEHQQHGFVGQGPNEVADQAIVPGEAGKGVAGVAIDGIGGVSLNVLVVAARFVYQLEVNIAQGGVKVEGVGLGLVEQHPLKARLPEV